MSRVIVWYSSGAASAVAAALTLKAFPDALLVKCETNAEHPDNERFDADVERWTGKEIVRLSSSEYLDTWHVWEDRGYVSGIYGAPCTAALKKAPRLAFQRPGDIHVFGYTADRDDKERADRLREANPDLIFAFPLIDKSLTKSAVLAMVAGAGIELPEMYKLGFQNNNCIPCSKASSPNYWAAIRLHFPPQFERFNALCHEIGSRPVILRREKGEDGKVKNIRGFPDEVPLDWPTTNPIVPACDFLCHIAEQDLAT